MSGRLFCCMDNLSTMSRNLQASRSRIADTDYSATGPQLSRSQIMQQASMAMLAQGNQMPQMVLQLLKAVDFHEELTRDFH